MEINIDDHIDAPPKKTNRKPRAKPGANETRDDRATKTRGDIDDDNIFGAEGKEFETMITSNERRAEKTTRTNKKRETEKEHIVGDHLTTAVDQGALTGERDQRASNFVYWMRQLDGARSSQIAFRVGISDNVAETRRAMENIMMHSLTTYRVIECTRGDADNILAAFTQKFAAAHLKNSWYKLTKGDVDTFAASYTAPNYLNVTEGKAKRGAAEKAVKAVPKAKPTPGNTERTGNGAPPTQSVGAHRANNQAVGW